MNATVIIGSLAALASTLSFLPQAWKVVRSGDVKDISRPMYFLTVTGFALWVTYGALQGDWPLIVTNGLCGVFAAFILVMTLLPRQSRKSVKRAVQG